MPNKKEKAARNILVIGGAGYIGSRIVPELIAAGHRVSVVDLLWFGDSLPADVPVTRIDAMDLTESAFKGFDVVIFLAGLSNDPMAEFDPRQNFISNAPTTAYCAMLAKKAGVGRFIYAGTCSVYGSSKGEAVEAGPIGTESHYGVSKYMGEVGVRQYRSKHFDVVILRQGTVSGWSPRMRFDLLVNTMYMRAATSGVIDVRNPSMRRPIFAMSDVVRTYLWAIDCVPGVYNTISDNVTIGGAARAVAAFFRKQYGREIDVRTQEIEDPRDYHASKFLSMAAGLITSGGVVSILCELDEKVGLDADFDSDRGYNIRIFEKL